MFFTQTRDTTWMSTSQQHNVSCRQRPSVHFLCSVPTSKGPRNISTGSKDRCCRNPTWIRQLPATLHTALFSVGKEAQRFDSRCGVGTKSFCGARGYICDVWPPFLLYRTSTIGRNTFEHHSLILHFLSLTYIANPRLIMGVTVSSLATATAVAELAVAGYELFSQVCRFMSCSPNANNPTVDAILKENERASYIREQLEEEAQKAHLARERLRELERKSRENAEQRAKEAEERAKNAEAEVKRQLHLRAERLENETAELKKKAQEDKEATLAREKEIREAATLRVCETIVLSSKLRMLTCLSRPYVRQRRSRKQRRQSKRFKPKSCAS